MIDFSIPEELLQVRQLFRTFIKNELLPLEKEVEETGELSHEKRLKLREKAIALNIWACTAPAEHGGAGIGPVGKAIIYEEIGGVSAAVGLQGGIVLPVSSIGIIPTHYEYATQEQKEKYLIPVIKGEKEAFIAITEPNAGSDVRAMQTTFGKEGEHYVINGNKIFITGVDHADFGLVFARGKDDEKKGNVSCFFMEKGTPGFSIGRKLSVIGRRGLNSYELFFDDCRIHRSQLLGKEGEGLVIAAANLAASRLSLAAFCCGVAQRVLDMSMKYAKQRITFGKPIAERQAVQFMLGDTYLELLSTRLLVYNVAWQLEQGKKPDVEAALLKAHATQMALRAADRAIQIHGGIGLTKDLPIEMIYRDLRVYQITDGPSEVLKWWAVRQLLKAV